MEPISDIERKIFDILIKKGTLSVHTLSHIPNYVNLVYAGTKKRKLIPTTKNFFILSDYGRLRLYAEELTEQGEVDLAQKAFEICTANTKESLEKTIENIIDAFLSQKSILPKKVDSFSITEIEFLAAYQQGYLKRLYFNYLIPDSAYFWSYGKKLEAQGNCEKAELCFSVYKILEEKEEDLKDKIIEIYRQFFQGTIFNQGSFQHGDLNYFICIRLVKLGILKMNKESFIPYNPKYFLELAKIFEEEGKQEDALECYRLMSTEVSNINMTMIVLARLVERGEYGLALTTLSPLSKYSDYRHLYYTYTYLLNFLKPGEATNFQPRVNIEQNDLIDPLSKDKEFEIKLKKTIYAQRFSIALKLLEQTTNNSENELLLKLLTAASKKKKQIKKKIVDCIDSSDPVGLYQFLKIEKNKHPLDEQTEIFCYISRDIYEKLINKQAPVCTKPRSEDLKELIRARAYPQAYQKSEALGARKEISPQSNYLSKLLKMACNYLFPEEEKPKKKESSKDHLKHSESFTLFLRFLRAEQFYDARMLAKNLLATYGLSEYYYLVNEMINISCLEEDKDFVRAVGTLIKLIKRSIFVSPDSHLIDVYKILDDVDNAISASSLKVAHRLIGLIGQILSHKHTNLTEKELKELIALSRMKLDNRENKNKK